MESVVIRPWVSGDIDYVVQSVSREEWGHSRDDIERCWLWEPNGCLVAEVGHDKVGHVSSIAYGRLGWIGLLIVNPERRGKGIGTALMKKAVDHLRNSGVEMIRLEAIEEAVPLYRRLGFGAEFESLRYGGRRRSAKLEPSTRKVNSVRPGDLQSLVAFDSSYFGSGRDRVLRLLAESSPKHCFLTRQSELLGYIMCRKTQNGYWIGPWASADPTVAEELLNAAVASIDEPNAFLRFGFPSVNEWMQKLMREGDFDFRGKCVRMALGKGARRGKPEHVFGIGGPEKG